MNAPRITLAAALAAALIAVALAPEAARAGSIDPRIAGQFRGTLVAPDGGRYDMRISIGLLFGRANHVVIIRDAAGRTAFEGNGDTAFDGVTMTLPYNHPRAATTDTLTVTGIDMTGIDGTFDNGARVQLRRVPPSTPDFWTAP